VAESHELQRGLQLNVRDSGRAIAKYVERTTLSRRAGRLSAKYIGCSAERCAMGTGPQYTPSPTISRWKSRWQRDITPLRNSAQKPWLTIIIAKRSGPRHLLPHAASSKAADLALAPATRCGTRWAVDRLPIRAAPPRQSACQVLGQLRACRCEIHP